MKIQLFCFIIIPLNFLISQENNAPEVTNITFSQRDDGSFIVDIYYDVNDDDGDTMSVTMYASDDAGTTWNFSCENITGDVGADITSGTGKHIGWDFGTEHPHIFDNQFQVKIMANDWNIQIGTVTDINGNVYQTVKIGDQWWMAENLKITRYRNGEDIPNITDDEEWSNLSTGAQCSYCNNVGNIETYGLLYNWYAVDDSRNIAPVGWHVPTNDEWMGLEMHLGMSQIEAWYIQYRGTDEGGKLKETGTTHWHSPNTGATNASGFTALPGGYRDGNNGAFYHMEMGLYGYWWSPTSDGSYLAYRTLGYDYSGVWLWDNNKRNGYSIRCIRD